ncbi:MAG: peptidylprolyl isomerase [Peptococcaceae bacterium]|jgi:parvulin-like peptidyl-prolyl isomerase|nr:peptidylprolyl isomerase [Peptococcaceae bacterium]
MKKVASMMAILLCLSLFAGCGGSGNSGNNAPGASSGSTAPGAPSGTSSPGSAVGSTAPQTSIGGISTGEHKVIATVNDEDIFEDVYMEWYLENMSLTLGLDMSSEQDEQVVAFIEQSKYGYLPSYTDQIILLQEAQKHGVAADDQEVEDYLLQIMGMYMADEESFKSIQAMWGFTDYTIRKFLKEQMTIQLLYEEKTKEVTEPTMTPEEYYNANPFEFRVDETRLVRHILVEQEGEAKSIISSLNKGEDFANLVMEYSIDTGSAVNGGFIGPFDSYGNLVSGGSLVAPFTEASFSLEKVGDFTQNAALSDFGYHIIILDEITPPYTLAFEDVKDDLAYQVLMEAKDVYFDAYYQGIMSAAVITYAEGVQVD